MATKFLTVVEGSVEGHRDSLRFALANGLKVEIFPQRLSVDMQEAGLFHGINQKVRDAAAGFSKDADYSGAFRAMQTVVDNLEAGLWNAKGGSGTADLVLAIAGLKKIETEEAQELVDTLDDEQLKAVMAKPAIKAAILKIKAERAAKVADASDDDLGI